MSVPGAIPPPPPDSPREWQSPRLRETALWIPFALIGRHPLVFFLVFFAVLSIGTAYIAAIPRAYESRAAVLVRIGSSDPTDELGVFPSDRLYQITVNNEIEAMRTDDVILGILARLEPETHAQLFDRTVASGRSEGFGAVLDTLGSRVRSWGLPGFPSDGSSVPTREADVIQHVRDSLWIELRRNSSVIGLSYAAPSPELAQLMLRLVLEKYQEIRAEYSTGVSSLDWLAVLRGKKSEELNETEREIVEFGREHQLLASPELELERIGARIAALEGQNAGQRITRASLAKQLEILERRLQSWRPFIEHDSEEPNEQRVKIEENIRQLELKLLVGQTDEGKLLSADARKRLEDAKERLEANLEELPETLPKTVTEPDVAFHDLRIVVAKLQAEVAAADTQLEQIDEQLTAQVEFHEQLRGLVTPFQQLIRARDERRDDYERLFKPLQRANLAGQADDSKETGVTVIEKPTLADKPSKPKRTILLAVTGVLALLIALVTSFLVESLRWKEGQRVRNLAPPFSDLPLPRPSSPPGVRKL